MLPIRKLILSFSFLLVLIASANAQLPNVKLHANNYYDPVLDKAVTAVWVENFVSMVSFQFSISYDTSIMTYDTLIDSGLEAFSEDNLFFPPWPPDVISVNWYQAGSAFDGETLENGTILFKLLFDLKTSQMGEACLGNYPTNAEFSNSDGILIFHEFYCESNQGSISGNLFADLNQNCSLDANENPLRNWLVRGISGLDTFYANSKINGDYQMYLDTGLYEIDLIPDRDIWEPCNTNSTQVFLSPGLVENVDLGAKTDEICPIPEIRIATPRLRRCEDAFYIVEYCNQGSISSTGTYIEVELDPYLVFLDASIPVSNQNGQLLTFNIGDLPSLECGDFKIFVEVDCDSTIVGQTHCTEARIYPHPPCGNYFNQPEINIEVRCTGSEALFFVKNSSTLPISDYKVLLFQEEILRKIEPLDLTSGEEKLFRQNSDEKTVLIQIQNSEGKIINGNALEFCGFSGSIQLVPVIQNFPYADFDLWYSTSCEINRGSFDPNDKTGYPLGLGEENIIQKGVGLDYRIRFQNTGNDTAFKVVILDTLSHLYDFNSIKPGISSHTYRYEFLGKGIIKFSFPGIELPDSTTNLEGSQGFVNFKIKPKNHLESGTRLLNRAAIYFDRNSPIITESSKHTIGEPELILGLKNQHSELIEIKTFPNPANDKITFIIPENIKAEQLQLTLFNSSGNQVFQLESKGSNILIFKKDLNSGVYYFQIKMKSEGIISSGTILFH
jgi:hypothetical protein